MLEEKTYKTRVELSFIVELDVDAEHEDNAAAIAEEAVQIDSEYLIDILKNGKYRVPNAACRCIEVNDYADSDE